MAIPDSILKKPGPLAPKEWDVIRRHPALGYGLVRDVKLVREVGNIILCHHERYDGTGYPKGLKGEAIPFEARIFAVADTVDAVTSHRPYRAPRDFRAARRELETGTPADSSTRRSWTFSAAWTWPSGRRSASRRPGSCRRSTNSDRRPPQGHKWGHDTRFPIYPLKKMGNGYHVPIY